MPGLATPPGRFSRDVGRGCAASMAGGGAARQAEPDRQSLAADEDPSVRVEAGVAVPALR